MSAMNATTGLALSALIVGMGIAQAAVAQPTFSGDVNADEAFDSPDAVLTVNELASPETLSAMETKIIDANQDGLVDSQDPHYVAEIIVGLSPPLPLPDDPAITTATFFRPPAVPPARNEDAVTLGAPSFERQ